MSLYFELNYKNIEEQIETICNKIDELEERDNQHKVSLSESSNDKIVDIPLENRAGINDKGIMLPSSLLAKITADVIKNVCDKAVADVQTVIIQWEFDKITSLEALKKIRKIVKEEKK